MARTRIYPLTKTTWDVIIDLITEHHKDGRIFYSGPDLPGVPRQFIKLDISLRFERIDKEDLIVFAGGSTKVLNEVVIPRLMYHDHPWTYIFDDEVYSRVGEAFNDRQKLAEVESQIKNLAL